MNKFLWKFLCSPTVCESLFLSLLPQTDTPMGRVSREWFTCSFARR